MQTTQRIDERIGSEPSEGKPHGLAFFFLNSVKPVERTIPVLLHLRYHQRLLSIVPMCLEAIGIMALHSWLMRNANAVERE